MGFPVCCSEVPKLILHLLILLSHLRRLTTWTLQLLGLGDFLDANDTGTGQHYSYSDESCYEQLPCHCFDEHLPVIRFADLVNQEAQLLPESCAVCLGEIAFGDKVRQPSKCRHVFHRSCIDRWWAVAHVNGGQCTCPLCRAPLLPDEVGPTFHSLQCDCCGMYSSSSSPQAAALLLPLQFPAA